MNYERFVTDVSVLNGGFIAGSLTNDDKTTSYGTAATSDFKSYISDPKLTSGMTSRILRNRYLSHQLYGYILLSSQKYLTGSGIFFQVLLHL